MHTHTHTHTHIQRQQLVVAQEMFKESPTLTREQKAGGSEGGKGEGGEGRNVLIETVFEMNYRTGLWRKLQFKRPWPLTSELLSSHLCILQ